MTIIELGSLTSAALGLVPIAWIILRRRDVGVLLQYEDTLKPASDVMVISPRDNRTYFPDANGLLDLPARNLGKEFSVHERGSGQEVIRFGLKRLRKGRQTVRIPRHEGDQRD